MPLHTPDGKQAAELLLAKLITEQHQGVLTAPSQMTVGAWLGDYLERTSRGRAPATLQDRQNTARFINGALGSVRLDKLTAARVQRWADELETSHRTRLKAVQLLKAALGEAVALEHLSRNPALQVRTLRQPSTRAGEALTEAQARRLLEANEGTHLVHLWRLALQTGARIGELLALEVGDYDQAAGTLRIERNMRRSGEGGRREVGPPKTAAGTRTFHLPRDAQQTVTQQLAHVEALRAKGGARWTEAGLLFPSMTGTHLMYRNVLRAWTGAQERAPDVPRVKTHDLRRTFISLALRRGVKPEVVARMVGHASPVLTLSIYRTIFEDELAEAARQMDGLL